MKFKILQYCSCCVTSYLCQRVVTGDSFVFYFSIVIAALIFQCEKDIRLDEVTTLKTCLLQVKTLHGGRLTEKPLDRMEESELLLKEEPLEPDWACVEPWEGRDENSHGAVPVREPLRVNQTAGAEPGVKQEGQDVTPEDDFVERVIVDEKGNIVHYHMNDNSDEETLGLESDLSDVKSDDLNYAPEVLAGHRKSAVKARANIHLSMLNSAIDSLVSVLMVYIGQASCVLMVYIGQASCVLMVYIGQASCVLIVYIGQASCVLIVYIGQASCVLFVYIGQASCVLFVYIPKS